MSIFSFTKSFYCFGSSVPLDAVIVWIWIFLKDIRKIKGVNLKYQESLQMSYVILEHLEWGIFKNICTKLLISVVWLHFYISCYHLTDDIVNWRRHFLICSAVDELRIYLLFFSFIN